MQKLTLEQQRDIARRTADGHRFAEMAREEEARVMTLETRWKKIEAVQGFTELFPSPKLEFDPDEDGLVRQQRRFSRIRAAR